MTTGFQYLFNEVASRSDIWNRRNVRGVATREVSDGGIYSETQYGEWQDLDVNVPAPLIPQARGLGFLLQAYQELIVDQSRINTTIQVQGYNLYEYDAIYDLENGRRVNEMINFGSKRLIDSYNRDMLGTARESRENRQCVKAVTC